MIAPESTSLSADVHFPSTISSNLHADEYESQSAMSKLVTGFEVGVELGDDDGEEIGDDEVGD